MLFRSFAADDIFISYTRLDASTYAVGLADELTKRGFSCFIDKLGTDPDKDLPDMLRRKVRSCAMLVIVGTERAGTRQTIEDEVKEFLLTGRRTSIVPIDFGGAVYKARWYGLVEGVAPEMEKNVDALDDGEPSPSVVSRIEKQFNYTRRNERLRRVTIGTASLLVLLILASVAAGVYAKQQIVSAREARARAEQARAEADVARGEAEAAKNEAATERYAAHEAKAAAEKQQDLANRAARRAADSDRAANAAKAEAGHQQSIANSRSFANRSQTLIRQRPDEVPRSVLLAVQSLKTARTVEADTALRESLALLPLLHRSSIAYQGEITHTALSPDGRHFATLRADKKLRIYESGSSSPIKELPCECSAVALSSDLVSAAVLTPAGIEIFDLHNGNRRSIKIQEGQRPVETPSEAASSEKGSVERIAVSPGGRYIAQVLDVGENQGRVSRVKVIDATTGKVVKRLLDDASLKANDIAFGASGNLAVGGSELGPNGRPVGRAIIWYLAISLWQQEAVTELTAEAFSHPTNFYQDDVIHVVAPGWDESYLATDSAVLKMGARREYEPVVRIPLSIGHRDDYTAKWDYALEDLAFNAAGDRLEIVRRLPSPVDDEVTAYEGSNKGLEEWDAVGHWDAAQLPLKEATNVAITRHGNFIPVAFHSDAATQMQPFLSADGSVAAVVKLKSLQAGLVGAVPLLTIGEGGAEVRGGHDQKIHVPFNPDFPNVVDETVTPDGKFLVTAGDNISFYALEGANYRLLKLLPVPEPMSHVALTPDGQILVTQTAEAGVVQVWRTGDGREVMLKGLHELSSMTSWLLSPEGRFLAVTAHGKENGVYVWRLSDGAPLGFLAHPYKVHVSLFFSPGERFLLTADWQGKTSLLDLSTGKVRNVHNDVAVSAAAFSEDDRYVGVGTEEGLLLVYPTDAPDNEIARLRHVGRVKAIAFSVDGRRLVTASELINPDNLGEEHKFTLRVWLLHPEDLIAEAEKRLAKLPAYAR